MEAEEALSRSPPSSSRLPSGAREIAGGFGRREEDWEKVRERHFS